MNSLTKIFFGSMLPSAFNSVCPPYKPFLTLSTLLFYHTSLSASLSCWQAPVEPYFPTDCRYILPHLPELPALAPNPLAADALVNPSQPFSLNISVIHNTCLIDTTVFGNLNWMPPAYHAPPRTPSLTEVETRETWTAVRQSVERVLTTCSDHGLVGEENILALPWGWSYVRITSIWAAAFEHGAAQRPRLQRHILALQLQQQVLRGEPVTWEERNVPDDLFGRTSYIV